MLDPADVFQLIVNSFNNGPFSQKDFVAHIHECISPIVPYVGNQLNTNNQKEFLELFANIALVGKQLSENSFEKTFIFQGLSVFYIGLGNTKTSAFSCSFLHYFLIELRL